MNRWNHLISEYEDDRVWPIIHTALVDNLFDKFAQENHCTIDDYWEKENALYARGYAGEPREVAEVIYFLSSDASSFCTGGHYLVDGGLVAR